MPSTPMMRAVVAPAPGGPEVLELREVPQPTPSAGEVLIRVAAAGVNPVDAKTRSGKGAGPFLDERRRTSADLAAELTGGTGPVTSREEASTTPGFPWIPGWDVAGTVEAVGFGASRFSVGDRVFGTINFPRNAGAYAEYVVGHVSQLSRSPHSLGDIETAALAMGGLTAWQALVDAGGLETNQRVVITAAAGGVGHLAVQIAVDLGAHVIAVGSTGNLDFLRGLGANEVIDRTAGDWTAQVNEPVDLVLDGSGHDQRAAAYGIVKPGGALIALPSAATGEPAPDTIRRPKVFVAPDGLELQLLTGGVVREMLTPHVSATFPLAEVARAHAQIESGTTRGKIVLTVGD